MSRFYFHLVSKEHALRDYEGIDLRELSAAHWHGVKLLLEIRKFSRGAEAEWMVKISDETGAIPLVVLPPPLYRHRVMGSTLTTP
jgi:hypothetical protein